MWRTCPVVATLLLVACRNEVEPTRVSNSAPAPAACIADRVGELRIVTNPWREGCAPEDAGCAEQCTAGDASACFNRASNLQQAGDEAEAMRLYERGCELGDSLSCINHGAGVWSTSTDVEALRCAERLFARTCDAGEALGCGMRGRVIISLVQDDADVARVRAYLEESCERVKGFPCRVLAYSYELDLLGAYDPAAIPELLRHACEGGDPEACGEPATAAETFR